MRTRRVVAGWLLVLLAAHAGVGRGEQHPCAQDRAHHARFGPLEFPCAQA